MMESILVIDKPVGITSFDVIRRVREVIPEGRVGHAGSLDPFASGVLLLLVGKATKLSGLFLNADKQYDACVKLGEYTDTYDADGPVTRTAPIPDLSIEQINTVAHGFEGEWLQTPPMYSAKKIRGVRLYELARQNIHVKRTPTPVQLYKVAVTRWASPLIEMNVHCSKGTYVRSLAEEFGRRLDTLAHLYTLRRTACGFFTLGESVPLETFQKDPHPHLSRGHQNFLRVLRNERFRHFAQTNEVAASQLPGAVCKPL